MSYSVPELRAQTPNNVSTISLDIPAAYSADDLLHDVDPAEHEDEEEQMSEEQLRQMYDDEEVDRFLHLFSTYVTEVRLAAPPVDAVSEANRQAASTSPERTTREDEEWVDIHETANTPPPLPPRRTPSLSASYSKGISLSEYIANTYIVPLLPEERTVPPAFTIGRFRLTVQRLFLAVRPIYLPFLVRMHRLATWKDPGRSLGFCVVSVLVPLAQRLSSACPHLRILYSLVRRRMFPYPSLAELRERRQEVERADLFSLEVSKYMGTSSTSGAREVWKLFQMYNKTRKDLLKSRSEDKDKAKKEKEKEKGHRKNKSSTDLLGELSGRTSGGAAPENGDPGMDDEMDGIEETPEEQDIKRLGLHLLADIADVHERMKKSLLFVLFVTTLVLPAKYLAKAVYGTLGVLFWHIVPVIAAMSIRDKQRLPPMLDDVPTDADVAMELISKRVAAGQDLRPKSTKTKKSRRSSQSNPSPGASTPHSRGVSPGPDKEKEPGVDWQKWGRRAAAGKAWAEDSKRLLSPKGPAPTSWPSAPQLVPGPSLAMAQPSAEMETHTFPAHHQSGPGLLTTSAVMLHFTPFLSAAPTISIAVKDLRGVKKTGLLKGVTLRYEEEGMQDVKEEKFSWVGGREELFARLIGPDRTRWLKA
ncbi:hypothetical protein BD626DRAFT_487385 [Schizophyllum amplum]|uniref:Uncharacterized protein n=1 Tax=Schizophyllum amplum TaxID=97359 RepID=A0A550CNE1_9AGAR|nr:hypothetical protein BD626DRAFT_487385 [Auriculariopsis ampla]